MSGLKLTKTKLQSGVWHGVIEGSGEQPTITVRYLDREVDGVVVTAREGLSVWDVRIPIPVDIIDDGVQTLLICDGSDQQILEKITLVAGEALSDDLRAEVDLLRAELDTLKRAFRRHCVETAV